MINFNFQNTTKIIFGKDTEKQVGEETAQFSKKVLLHYGGSHVEKSGLLEDVKNNLKNAGVEFVLFGGVKPNPRVSLVREGIELCRKENINFILAVGGGSVIDSAKAIAVGVPYAGDVWDFYLKTAVAKEALGIGVVLTIPAAGSESSNGSVITNEDGGYKRSYGTALMYPKFSILNPCLTYSLPNYQTICGAADIMAHVLERYFTNVENGELVDRLSEAVLKTMISNTPVVLKEPENYDARAEIMWAGTIAHNGLLSTGRIGDWGSHDIEHELSGIYDIAHGAGLAIVFPAWMKYVYKHDVNRFVKYAVRVWGVDMCYENSERTALLGIEKTEQFFKSLGLPTRLDDVNLPEIEKRIPEMARKATEVQPLGNFVKLDAKAIEAILNLAFAKNNL